MSEYINRQQLASFIKDDRTLRAMERVIRNVNEQIPTDITNVDDRVTAIESDITTIQGDIFDLNSEKQAVLVSGVNIKTINSNSILGSGDLTISGTGGNSYFPSGW